MKKTMLVIMSLLFTLSLVACASPASEPTAVPTATVCSGDSEICPVGPELAASATAEPVVIKEENSSSHSLVAKGSGQVLVTPDMAYLFIGLNNQSDVLDEAMDLNSTQTETIINAIKELGVSDDDIQTSNISVYPQTQYSPMGEITGTTYSIDNSVNISVRQLDLLNDVIEASLEAGANSVSGVQFDLSDKSSALAEAQQVAIEDAKAQAEQLAELAGVELGELANISVASSNVSGSQYYGGFGGGGAGMMNLNKIPVSAGQMAVTVEATLVYEIE